MASPPHRARGSSDPPRAAVRVSDALRDFLSTEIAGGALLLSAAVVALVWAALAFSSYDSAWTGQLPGGLARIGLPGNVRGLINQGLMTFFFFIVGLEIKREFVSGELQDRRAAALPVLAALGGMVVPAAIYLVMTHGPAGHGWGIPMATDIAFALGVLTLFGRGLPRGLRVVLLTLAVADDVGTLAVITIFYAARIRWVFLIGAIVVLAAVGLLAHRRWGSAAVYIIGGATLWWLTLRSGVPPTIAGVALGLLVPAGVAVIERIEHVLHPWTSFAILPLFALANAGLHIEAATIGIVAGSPVSLAVIAARIAGKLLGITLGAWIATRSGIGLLPEDVRLPDVVALGCVASVGFTIPLFVSTLAFQNPALIDAAKVGIFLTTVFGFAIGGLALRLAARQVRSAA
jgi:Na+:H+ antiporter, NhaA family